ncbi:hypothetical protein AFCDBAGC_1216 [Methylobacterium cerastii]|uniref:DUF427 domain-containing protein n=1 Tax=Methylobacterium cerastii TaxID=932741 RepID=A0ABQ4QDR5_9HYPH|nr:DUF427 domain-containing protein [Methylobacterium cerastii]TXN00609.1 DUF427 domain-containing protein [Methylobacterium sp. WL122]GJD43364.1 hypothetical protein AFCDBAGC_1216 [Methylobacterium cerastii]
MRQPGPDHPITVTPHPGRIRVMLNGVAVADSRNVLSLKEASYPPVLYIPRTDVDLSHFTPSVRTSHCPYKGDASYFSLKVGDASQPDAVWSYEAPFPAVAEIAGHVAFYPDRVDGIETT